MFHSLSGASRWSDYAAVSRVVRLSQYTCSGVLPSSALCGLRLVVERQVPPQSLMGGADAVVGPQIHLLVLHAPPQPFHEHVVPPAAGAVHTDLDAMVFQEPRELLAGELAALVRVEDVRSAVAGQGLLDRLDAEVGRQRVGQPPRQHPATRPVQDREEIHKATRHRKVRDIRRPDLIGSGDRQMAEQIRVHPMRRMSLAGVGFAVQRFDAHASHHGAHSLTPDPVAFSPQQVAQHSGSGKRRGQMELVDPAHQRQIRRGHRTSAGSRRSSATAPGAGIAAPPAVRGFGRSSLCAQQSRFDERPF